MGRVRFHSEDIPFALKNKTRVKNWIAYVIRSESRSCGDINYVFCSDKFLLGLNKEFLRHNTLTDTITFDYSEDSKISGEIFISIPRVQENARKLHVPFDKELQRVIVHGVLHLCGYKDKKAPQRRTMRRRENFYLDAADRPVSV